MQTPSAPWAKSAQELEIELHSPSTGLTTQEIKNRLTKYGYNELPQGKELGPVGLFLKQLRDPLIYILAFAGVLTILLQEWAEVIFIVAAILANAFMGFWQEWKAQSILDALKNYFVTQARVRRNGSELKIDARDLVPGDRVILKTGERVPADIRLILSNSLKADEAILTGESLPLEKSIDAVAPTAAIHERSCMLMSGTLITEGTGEGIVIATGANTAFGSIAALATQSESPTTPLQKAIEKLSVKIGFVALIATFAVFGIGYFTQTALSELVLLSIAIGVSLVPEGLPIALSVILAIGVERLAKKKGIVRKLASAEALGSTTLILTDKTGTLTEAKLSLSRIYAEDEEQALIYGSIASSAVIENPDQLPEQWRILGSPVDSALLRAAGLRLSTSEHLRATIIERKPFDSAKKYALTLLKEEGQSLLLMLGAPDYLRAYCNNAPASETIEQYASQGARLIGLCRFMQNGEIINESSLTQRGDYLGTFAFEDPLRDGVTQSVSDITASGVKTVMVTGDHPITAQAISERAGIARATTIVLSGQELDTLNDQQLQEKLPEVHAFARVTPQQKWRLVQAYQAIGEQVAVTGDGVNDAPALRVAEVGVAMGSGTDVAKESADIVILDDSYQTIVTAIHEGRKILNNIQKATTYLFSNAFNDLVMVVGSFALGLPSPLNALQILYANFFTDSFPAIGYAFEQLEDEGTNKHHPQRHDDVLGSRLRKITIISASLNAVILLGTYWIARQLFGDHPARTIGFAAMGLSHIMIATIYRSLYLPVQRYWLKGNTAFLAGVGIGLFLITCALYVPWLNHVLDTTPLNVTELLYAIIIAALASLPAEVSKRLVR